MKDDNVVENTNVGTEGHCDHGKLEALEENDDHMREPCPATNEACDHYSYQCDRNGEVDIEMYTHHDIPEGERIEGNCTVENCPLCIEDQPEPPKKSTPDDRLPTSMIRGAEDIMFNGPVTIDMNICVINDETGEKGHIPVSLGAFGYTSQAVIQARVAAFVKNELPNHDGFRLMTKQEAWDFTTTQKMGQYFELPGDEDWTPIDESRLGKDDGYTDEATNE